MRLRTGNKRRARMMQRRPVCCPKHGKSFRGAGWVLANGVKFALFDCPVAACRQTRLLHVAGEPMSAADREIF